jgi:hypothetical protein
MSTVINEKIVESPVTLVKLRSVTPPNNTVMIASCPKSQMTNLVGRWVIVTNLIPKGGFRQCVDLISGEAEWVTIKADVRLPKKVTIQVDILR